MKPDAIKAPQVTTLTVKGLIELAETGKLRVPPFQRPLRWTPYDRQLLVDSILQGYPIGTVLLWQKRGPAGPVRLGPLTFEGREEQGALWVVDGQQRIVSLVAASLLDQNEPSFPAFGLFVDLDEWRVLNDASGRRNQARYLPVTEAVDNIRLNKWVHREGLSGERLEAAFKIGDRLRDFRFPVITVETEEDTVLRVIFDRVNSGGKRLGANDIFSALHFAGTPSTSLAALEIEIEDEGRGKIPETVLHRSILAVLNIDSSRQLPQKVREPGVLSDKLPEVKHALARALDFLVKDADIWRFELLPHALVFPILSKFFSLHPMPHERNRLLLVRWLWRGLVHDVYQSAPTSLRKALAAIDHNETASIQRLLRLVPKVEPTPDFARVAQRAIFKNARTKMSLLAMLASRSPDVFHKNSRVRDPVELVGAIIDAGRNLPGQSEASPDLSLEILPRVLPVPRAKADPLYFSIANHLALPHPDYQIEKEVTESAVLQEHLRYNFDVPDEIGGLALVRSRVALLERLTFDFVARLAQWSANDRGPLDDDEAEADV